jgi:transmembrane 9 superfamily protein 2/4
MLENSTCKTLCTVNNITGDDAKFINERIREDYALNWLARFYFPCPQALAYTSLKQIDGLPAAEKKADLKTGDIFFDMGFNLGIDDDEYYTRPALNNHYEIVLEYHTPRPDTHRVVGVLVWPVRLVCSYIFTHGRV